MLTSPDLRGPWVFQAHSATELFCEMLPKIRLEGELAEPRGQKTYELLHAMTRLRNPRRRVLTVYGRNLNPFFNLAECLWIANGCSDAEWICYFNSKLRQVLDPPPPRPLHDRNTPQPEHFHAPYGERIRRSGRHAKEDRRLCQERDQLHDCYSALRNDPETRQAVITLWNPALDNPTVQTLDRPCNIAVTFKLRFRKLWMTVMNRSNDALYGLTSTNIVQFSTLQELLASWLGVDVGPYTHYSDSLHLYVVDPFTKELNRWAKEDPEGFPLYDYVEPVPMDFCTPYESSTTLLTLMRWLPWRNWEEGQEGLLEQMAELRRNAMQGFCSCPYWDSVGWALTAWAIHKEKKDWQLVFKALSKMRARDWGVECFRFMLERYWHEDAIRRARHIIQEEWGFQDTPVWKYVTHGGR